MTIMDFLQIVGMAVVGGLGGVAIFEVLHRLEMRRNRSTKHDSTP